MPEPEETLLHNKNADLFPFGQTSSKDSSRAMMMLGQDLYESMSQ
ncbi:MAG: hypothetical protein AAF483_06285 [Planctomycetota bacterium]